MAFATGCHEHMVDGQRCTPSCTGDLIPLNNLTCTYDLQGVGHLPGLEGNCVAADQLQSAQTDMFVWGMLRLWIETYGRNLTEGDFRRALAAALLIGEPAVQRMTAAELQRLGPRRLLAAEVGPAVAAEARGPAPQRWLQAFNATYVDARLFGLEYVLLPLAGGPSVQELKSRAEAISYAGTSEQSLFEESLNLTRSVDIITFQDLHPPLIVSHFVIVPPTTTAGPPPPLSDSLGEARNMASAGVAAGVVLVGACCGLVLGLRYRHARRGQEAVQKAAKKKAFGGMLPSLDDPEAMHLYIIGGGRNGEVYPEPAPEPSHPPTPQTGGGWSWRLGGKLSGTDCPVDGLEIHASPEPVAYLGDLPTAGPRPKPGAGHRVPQDPQGRGAVGPAEVQTFLWHHDGPEDTAKVMETWDSPKPHAMAILEADLQEASGELAPEDDGFADVPIALHASPEPRCVMQPPPGPPPLARVCTDELQGLDLELDEDFMDFPQPRESPLQEEVAESLRFFACTARGDALPLPAGQGAGGRLEVPDEGPDRRAAQGEIPNVHRSASPAFQPLERQSPREPSEGVPDLVDFSVFQGNFEDDIESLASEELHSL